MHKDFYYPSRGAGQIHGCCWLPEGEPIAVVQIAHGITEYALRYEEFARYLNGLGYLVVAQDHMGHGGSVDDGLFGYFYGGWSAAVADTYELLLQTRKQYPALPYILIGHSMGSFIVRTILCDHPNSGISGAILAGSGWFSKGLMMIGAAYAGLLPQKKPSKLILHAAFGTGNRRIPNPKSPYEWVCRDEAVAKAFAEDPLCHFAPTAGLMKNMMQGILYMERRKNLRRMKKDLPVLFLSGDADPVGNYGTGVIRSAKAFRKAGMQNVTVKLYPECRHGILHELNKKEIYAEVEKFIKGTF
jgi:alpha-beta hydrolase superfamily lysophospholipase